MQPEEGGAGGAVEVGFQGFDRGGLGCGRVCGGVGERGRFVEELDDGDEEGVEDVAGEEVEVGW